MGCFSEDGLPGYFFHFVEDFAEFSPCGTVLFDSGKLLLRESHRDCFSSDFAGPLVACASSLPTGPILNRSLADENDRGHAPVQGMRWILAGPVVMPPA